MQGARPPGPAMVDPIQRKIWVHRAIFVMIALVLFFVRLLPMGADAGSWPGPDILLCVIFAWVQRRPDYLPIWLILLVVLTEDFLLMRPPGLWTALVILASEFLRNRAGQTRELGLIMEWLLIALLMIGILLAYRMVFAMTFLPQPGFGFAMIEVAASILCYPFVVGLSLLAVDLYKPVAGEVDAIGRRM